MPRVALLLPADIPLEAPFRDALRELDYVEGTNVAIERRSAGGDFSRLPALAAALGMAIAPAILARADEVIR